MEKGACYENYPWSTVATANLFSLAGYGLGLYILFRAGLAFGLAFLAFILWKEFSLMSGACRHCWYYGRTCMSGHGRIASAFFKRGDGAKFSSRSVSWKDLLSDILLLAIPLVAAIVLLLLQFNWPILAAAFLLVGLSTAGNAFVRGKLACAFCKQRELGCPAQKLFEARANRE